MAKLACIATLLAAICGDATLAGQRDAVKRYWVSAGNSHISFVSESDSGTNFDVQLAPGQSLQVIERIGSGTFKGDYRVKTEDGRELILLATDYQNRQTTRTWLSAPTDKQLLFATAPDKLTLAVFAGDKDAMATQAKLREEARRKAAAQRASEAEAAATKAAVELRTRAAVGPPRIGMPPDAVRNGTWGDPISVRRTTTAAGVVERWEYGRGRILLFRDGLLASITE